MNNNIVNLLSNIHEFKGKQELYIEAKPDILSSLLSIAKIQSTSSSNKIEGIYTTDQRISEITEEYGVRPVINLKADVAFTGDGSYTKPYVITTN